jgi:DNA-binding SARP family transcriptional activator
MPLQRCAMLAYLIIHRSDICTVGTLAEHFSLSAKQPEGALRNLVYRIRKKLAEIWPDETFICSQTGGYQWNPSLKTEVDFETFDTLYHELKAEDDPDAQIELGLELFQLYKGDFNKTVPFHYEWLRAKSTYYQNQMTDVLKILAKALPQRRRTVELENISVFAIQQKFADETLHQTLIRAGMNCELYAQAKAHCQWLIDFLRSDLEIEPSEATFDLHAKAISAATSVQTRSLIAILGELDAAPDRDRALYCELGIFKTVIFL